MKITIIEKIYNVSRNLLRDLTQYYRASVQARETRKLRQNKSTDYRRWERTGELYPDWDERTTILGEFIKPESQIVEFGAGNMALRDNLPAGCSYTPSDIYKRSDEVIVCDLNKPILIDFSKYDTAVFSGVLEYVYDIDKVFNQLKPFVKYVVLSYSCKDITDTNRLERGWLSDYTRAELERIFKKYDYEIINKGHWRKQILYSLEQKNNH